VNSFGALSFGDIEDLFVLEVRLSGWGRAKKHRLIRKADVHGIFVLLTVDSHGLNAKSLASSDDTHGDLSTIRNQNLLEQLLAGWDSGSLGMGISTQSTGTGTGPPTRCGVALGTKQEGTTSAFRRMTLTLRRRVL
jgi:hypothetical protein